MPFDFLNGLQYNNTNVTLNKTTTTAIKEKGINTEINKGKKEWKSLKPIENCCN